MRRREEARGLVRLAQRIQRGVKQVADSPAVHGRDPVRLAHAKLPELGGQVFAGPVVDLVHRERDRLAAGPQHLDDALVGVRQPHVAVHDEDDRVRQLHGDLRLRGDGGFDAFDVGLPAAGVDELEFGAGPFRIVADTVPGHSGRVFDDRGATAEDAVDERRLAHVRAADHGEHSDGLGSRRLVFDPVPGTGDDLLVALIQFVIAQIGGILLVLLHFDRVRDQRDQHIQRLLEIHIGVVDGGHAVRRGQEAGDLGIGAVAGGHVLAPHAGAGDGLPRAARLTHLFPGGQQHTHLGIGSHDRGDVTALRDDAAAQREGVGRGLARNVGALRGDEHVAHRDDVRHLRHVRGDLGGADGLTDVLAVGGDARMVRVDADVEVVAGEEFGDCFGDLLLIHLIAVEVDALMQAPPGACAVHGAGIEVGEAEMAGQRLRSGGLSDARRAVDGDSYHSPTSFCRERTSTWDSTR